MKYPMVSIVIPVYNGSNYLKDAIDSALNQTYGNFEVIVVNDGSDDNGKTEKIALSYGNRIRYFKKENGGAASAVNLGIRKMNGEYFSWLSHDDMYYPNKIEKQIEALKQDGDMLRPVFSAYQVLDMINGKEFPQKYFYKYKMKKINQGVFSVLSYMVATFSVMVHKSHFKRCGLFNESLETTQDYDMWFRIFHNQKPLYVPEILVKSRRHAEMGSETISAHHNNCDMLHIDYLHDMLTRECEIKEIYGDRYRFLYEMMLEAKIGSFEQALLLIQEYIKYEEEPLNLKEYHEKLAERLKLKSDGRLVIFGAGKNGIRISRDLILRNINVDAFADNDKNKSGNIVHGIQCISADEIDRVKDIVIISIDNEKDAFEQLRSLEIENIISGEEIETMIYDAVPYKKDMINLFKN